MSRKSERGKAYTAFNKMKGEVINNNLNRKIGHNLLSGEWMPYCQTDGENLSENRLPWEAACDVAWDHKKRNPRHDVIVI